MGDEGYRRGHVMTCTIAFVLAVLALLGFVSSYTMGWLAHVLLVVAVSVTLARVIYGRTLVQ